MKFLSIMAIFIQYPWLAALIGVFLVSLGRSRGRRTAMVVGVTWLLYAAYETAMRLRWLCSGECNIRIDLLVIYPMLLIGSIAAGVSLIRGSREPRPPA